MRSLIGFALGATIAVAGCSDRPPAPSAASPPAAAPAATATPASAKPAGGQAAALQMLDQMDTRRPLTLLPMMANHQKQNMRAHLQAVQDIVAGLAANDFAAVEKGARAIGFSDQMGQMCTHMGAATPEFTPLALEFHHTADTIGEAARKKDSAAVLKALQATLATCTACHAVYKQRVVDEGTWTALAGQAPPSPAAPH